MAIHKYFSDLRNRLAVHTELPSIPQVYTPNTNILPGVTISDEHKNLAKQYDSQMETPATPVTPNNGYDDEYWQELYEERAGIIEYDGGLSRAEAERCSHEFVQQRMKEENDHAQNKTQ